MVDPVMADLHRHLVQQDREAAQIEDLSREILELGWKPE